MSEHKLPKSKKTRRVAVPTEKVVKRPKADLDKLKDAKMPTRRVKMLMINPADFIFLFTKGLKFRKNFKLIKGIPEDAKFLAMVGDSPRNGVMIVVQSEEFDEVPINILPPAIPVDIDLDAVERPTKKTKIVRKKK